jgi:hypothetical protein
MSSGIPESKEFLAGLAKKFGLDAKPGRFDCLLIFNLKNDIPDIKVAIRINCFCKEKGIVELTMDKHFELIDKVEEEDVESFTWIPVHLFVGNYLQEHSFWRSPITDSKQIDKKPWLLEINKQPSYKRYVYALRCSTKECQEKLKRLKRELAIRSVCVHGKKSWNFCFPIERIING